MGSGSGPSFGAPGSQDGGIPEPYGADPSIAPGLARPQGWRVAMPDGTGAWDKTGSLDTDWTPVAPVVTALVDTLTEANLSNASGVTPIGQLLVVRVVVNFGIAVAQADSPANSAGVVGITQANMAPFTAGPVVIAGETSATGDPALVFAAGEQVWLSPTVAGNLTNVKPVSNAVHIGTIKAAFGAFLQIDVNIYNDPQIPVGDVTAVQSGDAGIVVTNGTGPIPIVGQVIAAEWPIANMRVYAVDFVSGNDANAGFADAAGTTAGDYATACTAAGAVAKKTFAGLAAIFPRVGNGRLVEVVIRNGGVNTAQAYTGGLDTFLKGGIGWGAGCPIVRGTGTNTTAGCTAFDGSSADFDYQGGITVAGLNAAGYNPSGASTTSLPCVLAGGGAPGLPAEPGAPLGWRVRFDAATATAALRNQCRQIAQVTATTITPQTAFSAAPANTDVFYIEQAGINVDAYTLGGQGIGPSDSATGMQISGIRSTGNVIFADVRARVAFCSNVSSNAIGYASLTTAQSIVHPILGTRTIGGGWRCEGLALLNTTFGRFVLAGLVTVTNLTVTGPHLSWGAGCYAHTGVIIQNSLLPQGLDVNTPPQVGITAALAQPRTGAGRLQLQACTAEIGGCLIQGAGANAAIRVIGRAVVVFAQAVCGGATGNNDVGLNLTEARGALIILSSTPTVTGALGDIRLAGGQIITWNQAIATGITDSAGNRIIGTAGVPPQGMDTKAGSVLSGAAPASSWMADESMATLAAAGANSFVFPNRYPTSLRLMTRLRAMLESPGGPTAQVVTATLYKNGVATAMVATFPVGTLQFDKIIDLAHPILLLDGDDWGILLGTGVMGLEGPTLYLVTATAEWAA